MIIEHLIAILLKRDLRVLESIQCSDGFVQNKISDKDNEQEAGSF